MICISIYPSIDGTIDLVISLCVAKKISDTKQWHTNVKIKLLSEFKVILYNSIYVCYKK